MTRTPDPLLRLVGQLAAAGLVEVVNARGEFACNSSSSHSIVVLPEGLELGDDEPGGEYGWECFTLTSSTSKVRYLAAMLARGRTTRVLADELRATLPEWDSADHVDHQSQRTLPRDRFGRADLEFARDLAELLTHPRVAVLGGNDNSGEHPALEADGVEVLPLPEYGDWVVRKDVLGEDSWWVLFNQSDGTKLRLRLRTREIEDLVVEVPEKSPVPELADVKLTDRCAYETDCGFCYMGSTRDGVEGDPTQVMELIVALAELGVFEIAFGGGEPTLWPHLEETLRFCRSVGVVPNFTTKNHTVLTTRPELLEQVGAVAFSVNDLVGFQRLQKAYNQASWAERSKVTIQMVPEVCSTPLLEQVLDWAAQNHVRVTLLGYKTTGRGNLFDGRVPRPAGFWIEMVRTRGEYLRVAVDTVLAEACQGDLEAAGVPSWCYHTVEGKSSVYVDAVSGKVGPSSYCAPDLMSALPLGAGPEAVAAELLDAFGGY